MQQPIHIIPVTTRRCEQFALQQPAKTKVPCFSYHAQCLGGPASPGGVGRKRSKEGKKHTHTKERGKSLTLLPHQSLLLLSWHLRNASHTSWQGETYDS